MRNGLNEPGENFVGTRVVPSHPFPFKSVNFFLPIIVIFGRMYSVSIPNIYVKHLRYPSCFVIYSL